MICFAIKTVRKATTLVLFTLNSSLPTQFNTVKLFPVDTLDSAALATVRLHSLLGSEFHRQMAAAG